MAFVTAAATLGANVLGALGATGAFATGVTFATVAVGFASQAALGLALNALTPKPKISRKQRGYTVNQRQPALDHQIVYGRARVGGAIVFQGTTGNNNKFLHQVVAYTGHEIQEFEDIYINDAKVTDLESDGNVKEIELPDGNASNRYDGKLRIKQHLGASDQTADSDLVNEFPKWTNDHRLRGLSYLYCRFEFDSDVYPNGIPEVTATIKGKKVFDPRNFQTYWSDNPALCLRDYIESGYGLNENRDNIDGSLVRVAADVCDRTALNGEKWYTCNGNFTTELTPYDVLNDLLSSMGGLLWYSQGKWRMKPAYWTPPEITLTEDDLRSEISVQTRHSRRDNFNTVKGTFRGEETDWQVADFPEVTDQAFLNADNGQESVIDFELPFTDNSEEARRIARIALERNRQQLTVQASWGLRAFQVQVGSIVNLSIDRFGWDQKAFEVTSWTFGLTDAQDLQVQMTLREISESVFDEIDDGIVYERDNTNLPSPFITVAPENLTVSDGGFTTDDGTFVNSFIVDWGVPDDAFVDYYELEWRVQGDSVFKGTSLSATEYQISPVIEGVTYDIRVKAINTLGASGPYASTTAQVGGDTTAPGLPTSISATGGFKYITIDWTNPPDADLNYIEVWESTSNTTSGATLVGEPSGNQFVRTNLGLDETRFYFLRSVDYSGNTSGYTTGVSGTTTYLDDPDFENGIRTLFEDQGLYPIEDVNSLPASGSTGQKVFNRADGKLYEWDGSSWVLVIASAETDDLIGQITETQITDNAISTPKLQAGAVTADEISGNTITGDKIVANTITGGLLATSGVITDSAQIDDALITNAKIGDLAVDSAKIADAAITSAKIGDLEVDSAKIADLTVGTNKITGNAVTRLGVDTNNSQTFSTADYEIALDVTVPTEGGNDLLIETSGEIIKNSTPGGTGEAQFRIYRDGSTIFTSTDDTRVFNRTLVSTSLSGSTHIQVRVRDSSASASVDLSGASLVVTEFKK